MGRPVKVTVCQLDNRPDQLQPMLGDLTAHIETHSSDFLLLPEFCFNEWLPADPTPDEDRWQAAVAAHEAWIDQLHRLGAKAVMATRPVVNAKGSFRNQTYVWTPADGARAVHEKYYLPDETGYWEHTWYDRGDGSFEICRSLGMRIGVLICSEMWFFEWARHYARSRAELLCVPRATPYASLSKWLAGGRTAAVCPFVKPLAPFRRADGLWGPGVDHLTRGRYSSRNQRNQTLCHHRSRSRTGPQQQSELPPLSARIGPFWMGTTDRSERNG